MVTSIDQNSSDIAWHFDSAVEGDLLQTKSDLVGGLNHLEKYLVNGKDCPIYYGKIKNDPNHQPEMDDSKEFIAFPGNSSCKDRQCWILGISIIRIHAVYLGVSEIAQKNNYSRATAETRTSTLDAAVEEAWRHWKETACGSCWKRLEWHKKKYLPSNLTELTESLVTRLIRAIYIYNMPKRHVFVPSK